MACVVNCRHGGTTKALTRTFINELLDLELLCDYVVSVCNSINECQTDEKLMQQTNKHNDQRDFTVLVLYFIFRKHIQVLD